MVRRLVLKETDQDELIKAMVGRDASNFYQKASTPSGDQALKAEHYSGNRIVKDVKLYRIQGRSIWTGGPGRGRKDRTGPHDLRGRPKGFGNAYPGWEGRDAQEPQGRGK